MSSKHRYLLNRDGRYFARIVIPKPLRPFLENKAELREPLGPDRRTAIARLATAVSALQGRVAVAERKAQIASGEPITPGRYGKYAAPGIKRKEIDFGSVHMIASSHYDASKLAREAV